MKFRLFICKTINFHVIIYINIKVDEIGKSKDLSAPLHLIQGEFQWMYASPVLHKNAFFFNMYCITIIMTFMPFKSHSLFMHLNIYIFIPNVSFLE
jgi:hypothetical protein